MTRPVIIPKHTLVRAAQVARKEGVAIVVEAGGVKFTILPDAPDLAAGGEGTGLDKSGEFSLC